MAGGKGGEGAGKRLCPEGVEFHRISRLEGYWTRFWASLAFGLKITNGFVLEKSTFRCGNMCTHILPLEGREQGPAAGSPAIADDWSVMTGHWLLVTGNGSLPSSPTIHDSPFTAGLFCLTPLLNALLSHYTLIGTMGGSLLHR